MPKLYNDIGECYSADHTSPNWKDFINKKPYNGNATCPITILDFSWYIDEDDEKEDKENILFLICKQWNFAGPGYKTFTFGINVTKEDEPEIKKFIKKHKE
ncbi:MAG: hypothetical protein Edafosvirus10_4 [Edafosvirus sp.]|uniref:Uncharacterized protein n=1 Tax=Edafosvirus sp. TaxID=2487765 RepID=A0A3G4ZY56_9VIRU|nr:MAG: hypothetical protein Edafosvirus10_4 [Edafosvirus sp.]